MTKTFYNKLACPYDKTAPLTLTIFRIQEAKVREGLLECPRCHRYYPIIGGIPILSPDDFRDASLEANFLDKWKVHLGDRYGRGVGFTLPPRDDVQTTAEPWT